MRIKMRRWFKAVWRFLRTLVLINLAIFGGVGLICWLGGWRTLDQYGNGLMLAGAAALAFGVYSVSGGWHGSRSFDYQFAASAGEDSVHKSANRERQEAGANYAFLGQMCVIGFLPIVVGILLQLVFGSVW
jgi:hypothetical protein